MVRIEKTTLSYKDWTVNAFRFFPPETKEMKPVMALFTHGYTSSKSHVAIWATRLAEDGLPSLIFDLPGHYLGSFNEVEDFEAFKENAHKMFVAGFKDLRARASELYPERIEDLKADYVKLILGGHSLGGLLSIKALELAEFKNVNTQSIAVGFGLGKDKNHALESPFFKTTLNMRRQLVSPALAPENVFGWIHACKENLKIMNKKIHVIVGEDDVVVSKEAAENLHQKLEKMGNFASMTMVKHLPHHLPELAIAHIRTYLKQSEII